MKINHPFWGIPIFRNTQIPTKTKKLVTMLGHFVSAGFIEEFFGASRSAFFLDSTFFLFSCGCFVWKTASWWGFCKNPRKSDPVDGRNCTS